MKYINFLMLVLEVSLEICLAYILFHRKLIVFEIAISDEMLGSHHM